MEKVIDLEEIIKENLKFDCIDSSAFENCKNAMMEFGKQLLELAAENAETIPCYYKDLRFDHAKIYAKSIINTINKVKL